MNLKAKTQPILEYKKDNIFREYLTGSTIHGLSYIGKTKKLIRIAWIIVVLSGFTIAGYLIWNSLNNWMENPVATTISTYPIEQVSLPKIYVCPPKHTYTNLNQDIVEMKDISLTNNQIEELMSLGSCGNFKNLAVFKTEIIL